MSILADTTSLEFSGVSTGRSNGLSLSHALDLVQKISVSCAVAVALCLCALSGVHRQT